MKILITSNDHPHYDKTGEIVGRLGEKWEVRIPNKGGSLVTFVNEGDFKLTKDQSVTEAVEAAKNGDPEPLARLISEVNGEGNEQKAKAAAERIRRSDYQPDGLGCVEKVSGVERDWDQPRPDNPYGY